MRVDSFSTLPSQTSLEVQSNTGIRPAEDRSSVHSARNVLHVLDSDEITERTRKRFRRKEIVHFAAVCFAIFAVGWNDGTTGPLLPRIQHDYNVSFSPT